MVQNEKQNNDLKNELKKAISEKEINSIYIEQLNVLADIIISIVLKDN